MPRAEAGTPKAIANAMKSKGLGRLRWYCQVCEKQCRDENGFKMHAQSETHLRKMLVVGESAGRYIDDFSRQFLNEFISLLSQRHGTQRVRANAVYNEYIQDKHHVHMNSTKWLTLTEFIKYLGREGKVRVDENEKGWWISWVDNSPKALARQAEAQKRERADLDDEQRTHKLLQDQIARAQAQAAQRAAEAGIDPNAKDEGLKREEGEKVSLSLNLMAPKPESGAAGEDVKPDVNAAASTSATPLQPGPTPAEPAKLSISAPAKKPQPGMNIFKQKAASAKRPRDAEDDEPAKMTTNLAQKKFLTAAEKLMLEDQARRKGGAGLGSGRERAGGGYQGMGPQRGGR